MFEALQQRQRSSRHYWTRALAIGTQSIATPMNRTVVDAISNTLVLQTMAG